MILDSAEIKSLQSEYEVDYEECAQFMRLVFEKCYNEINMFVNHPVNIDFKVDMSMGMDGTLSKIDARANEEGNPFVGIEYSYWLLINKFYNTVFSEKNSGFLKLITYVEQYDESAAKYWSVFMKKLTLEVVIFHELGHIYGGHLKKGNSVSACAEENAVKKHEKGMMFYQAREIDADRFAAYNLVSYYISDSRISNLARDYNVKLKGKEHMLIVLVYASILAFSILGAGRDTSLSQKDFKEIDHFPSRYRAWCYYRDMVEAYNRNYSKVKVELMSEDEVIKVIMCVENWFDYYMRDVIEVTNWSSDNNGDVFDEEHKDYYQKVFDYMKKEFLGKINPEREGVAKIKDIFITPEEIMYKMAIEDGGEFLRL